MIKINVLLKLFNLLFSKSSNQAFLERVYQIILERDIDRHGLACWLEMLEKGMTKHHLIRAVLESREFSQKIMGGYPSEFWGAIHTARCEMVKTLLPPAQTILDLGGANPGDEMGALLSFGYPHSPEKLYIVDLPPKKRMIPAVESSTKLNYKGCDIEYIYTHMSNLDLFKDESFDLVWSGESIEHVSRADAQQIFAHVHRLLKPGGTFALDTPNRRMTQLQNPYGWIHPEHQLEYYYDDLIEMLEQNSFKIVQTKGIIEFPKSIQANHFISEEVFTQVWINDRPRNSYLFYLACTR
ncbi:MAG: methyltransferase domain-containing protein [Leptolyngbyaceae cyanobacterium SU_3_3]|nr:methyltransferase domain-containing protein [Leptolyngbyaceae cyanobacterium SU_3_3]